MRIRIGSPNAPDVTDFPRGYRLVNGRGAVVKGNLADEEYLAVAHIDGGDSNGRIFLAAPIAKASVESGLVGEISSETAIELNNWIPKTRTIKKAGLLVIDETVSGSASREDIVRSVIAQINQNGIESLPWDDRSLSLRARIRFVKRKNRAEKIPDFSDESLRDDAENWLTPFVKTGGGPVIDSDSLFEGLLARLGWSGRKIIDELAPQSVTLPSGSGKQIDYCSGEVPVLSARLQEFFGCTETPKICGEPLLLHLLSPAGSPVQVTSDLKGFWERGYPEVKKELMGRYPRHYWPNDPLNAPPTARAKPRIVS